MGATKSKIGLILHPVRMRIIQSLLGNELTVREIAQAIPDVPQATLYRHIKVLAEAGALSVVEENRVRGAVERVYAVALDQMELSPEELAGLTHEDHRRMFMSFIASVIGGFERYLGQGRIDLVSDGVSYRQAPLYLDDDAYRELLTGIGRLIGGAMEQRPAPGRRRRTLSLVIVPEPQEEGDE